jgi:hypothetical protein
MGSRLVTAAAGGLMLLALAAPAQAGISPDEAFSILNQWRAEAKVPPVGSFTPAKNSGCDKHNNYMQQNNQLTHSEEMGKPGYTDEGATAGARSVLAFGEHTPRVWESAVYHRMNVLHPRLVESGWAASHGYTCLQTIELADGNPATPVTTHPWPPDGGTGVPLAFTDNESPDPHLLTPGVQVLGYLLSVNLAGPWFANYTPQVRVAQSSLVTDAGNAHPFTVADDQTPNGGPGDSPIGPYMNEGFALFPHGAFKPATTYTAHAAGTITHSGTSYPFDVTWSFTTAGQPVPGVAKVKIAKGKLSGKKVHFTLTASAARVGHQAVYTVNGKKPKTITLAPSQTIKVSRPGKGKSVKLAITTDGFTIEGVAYPVAKASRTYKRPK